MNLSPKILSGSQSLALLWLGLVERQFQRQQKCQWRICCVFSLFCFIDWNQTSYGLPSPLEKLATILPLILHHSTPSLPSIHLHCWVGSHRCCCNVFCRLSSSFRQLRVCSQHLQETLEEKGTWLQHSVFLVSGQLLLFQDHFKSSLCGLRLEVPVLTLLNWVLEPELHT